MKQLSMTFWQTFSSKSQHCKFYFHSSKTTVITGAPHIFLVVGALTSNAGTKQVASAPNLGEVIDNLSSSNKQERVSNVQHHCNQNAKEESSQSNFSSERPRSLGSVGSMTQCDEVTSEDTIIYSMAVWLVAKDVIFSVDDHHGKR